MNTRERMRKKITRAKIGFFTYARTINFLICRLSTPDCIINDSKIKLGTGERLLKICHNMFKLNQNWSIKI